jgi:hypothetical protein
MSGSFFQAYSEMKVSFWLSGFNQNKKAVDLCDCTKTTARETLSHRPMIFLRSTELPRTITSYASHWKTKIINNIINHKYGFQH